MHFRTEDPAHPASASATSSFNAPPAAQRPRPAAHRVRRCAARRSIAAARQRARPAPLSAFPFSARDCVLATDSFMYRATCTAFTAELTANSVSSSESHLQAAARRGARDHRCGKSNQKRQAIHLDSPHMKCTGARKMPRGAPAQQKPCVGANPLLASTSEPADQRSLGNGGGKPARRRNVAWVGALFGLRVRSCALLAQGAGRPERRC